jgi:hypothetical protein
MLADGRIIDGIAVPPGANRGGGDGQA